MLSIHCVCVCQTIVKTRRSRTFQNHPGTNAPVGRPEVLIFFTEFYFGIDKRGRQYRTTAAQPPIQMRSSLRKYRPNHFPKRDNNISIIIISSSSSLFCFCFKGHHRVTRQVIGFWPFEVPENFPFVFIPSLVTIPTRLWYTTACA